MTASVSCPTIRPLAAVSLYGLIFQTVADHQRLLAIDSKNGYLLSIDPLSNHTEILNPAHWQDFVGATGLALVGEQVWFTAGQSIYTYRLGGHQAPEFFLRWDYALGGIALEGTTLYATCQRSGDILVFNTATQKLITRFYAPGIGFENLTLRGEELWVTDSLEQTVYCLDRATGEVRFSVLTPFENPTGLAFGQNPKSAEETLFVAYIQQEPYIRDNPNADPNHELHYRARTFVHPLYISYNSDRRYALSNGFLVEMTYAEELSPLDPVELNEVEWRMALPAETPRQKIRSIEPIGLPFSELIETEEGQRIAVFRFDQLNFESRAVFGWKVVMEVWSIKYRLTPKDCENLPPIPPDFPERYLVDNDNLSMDTEIILQAAEEAIARETNILRKMYSIRNYVYDRLSYGIKPHIDTPDMALRRGVGSCGEYVGVLLALARLNEIPCRTVGRYKCPAQPLTRHLPLEPDFNHVWLEFYLPGWGWVPMESNPDDVIEGGPYPTRFFMGLAWYHAEMSKDTPFEVLMSQGKLVDKQVISIGSLALNHVQFSILDELIPGDKTS
ncbi:MAG: transglutaminase domain-containing protein [Merismopediaceae bacterium]|nr:transglutaminase domain-containing protein [Merismopediaceae bacterium]